MSLHFALCRFPKLANWLLAACLLAIAVPTAQAAPVALGINAMWMPGDANSLRARFQKAKSVGVTQVRLDWEWRQVEVVRGTYQWQALDTLVKTAYEEGIELLPIVHYAPAWALRPETKPDNVYEMAPTEAAYADYARFVKASIERYGPGGNAPVSFKPILYWQLWNEPNIEQFWGPTPEPAGYAKLMKITADTLAPLRAQVKLVHAGISKADFVFLWQLWEANPLHGNTFDIMAVHPYIFHWWDGVREPEAMDENEDPYAALGIVGSSGDPAYLGKVYNLQKFMTLKGALNKPIWITEMGYFVADQRLGVTDAGQAERLKKTIDFINQRLTQTPYGPGIQAVPANVQRVYWFALEDYPSPEGLGTFGLFRADGTARPAAEVFRNLPR